MCQVGSYFFFLQWCSERRCKVLNRKFLHSSKLCYMIIMNIHYSLWSINFSFSSTLRIICTHRDRGAQIKNLPCMMLYHIVGNFWGRKLSWIGKKRPFCGENFHRMLKPIIGGYGTPKFHGENFRRWTAKFVNIFSLESFQLYGSKYIKQTLH